MKKTTLTFCIVMVAIAVQAQHKKATIPTKTNYNYNLKFIVDSNDSLFYKSDNSILTGNTLLPNMFIVGEASKTLFTAIFKYKNETCCNIDSVILHLKKSQIKWVNDSTAVIYKP